VCVKILSTLKRKNSGLIPFSVSLKPSFFLFVKKGFDTNIVAVFFPLPAATIHGITKFYAILFKSYLKYGKAK